ncbi:hypothetical protein PoB_003642200 [Plakobranchus ocellatus]|uniref:Uncharacterized protein n=1 Tax=Plakobranchus ocellatus TaxID=259542 RepID=A0AAV4ASM1_9GAST|nr:hypothetical protein PoB_003642200 [Plakobranchus ocellatus]
MAQWIAHPPCELQKRGLESRTSALVRWSALKPEYNVWTHYMNQTHPHFTDSAYIKVNNKYSLSAQDKSARARPKLRIELELFQREVCTTSTGPLNHK